MKITIDSQLTIQLPADSLSKLDCWDFTYDLPKGFRWGFAVSHDVHWNEHSLVGKHLGYLLRPDCYMAMSIEWYEKNTLYFYADKPTELTFRVVPDSLSWGAK